MTYILMFLFIVVYAAIILINMQYQPDKQIFFDLSDSTMLKGMFCIIVVMVHIPAAYQNRIQDMMGSFAYIGVTFFFMTSSYGLKYGVTHKENYLRDFWLKRLPALLVPLFLCNIISVCLSVYLGNDISIRSFIKINAWVRVLLLFYIVFWLVYYIPYKLKLGRGGVPTGCNNLCNSCIV